VTTEGEGAIKGRFSRKWCPLQHGRKCLTHGKKGNPRETVCRPGGQPAARPQKKEKPSITPQGEKKGKLTPVQGKKGYFREGLDHFFLPFESRGGRDELGVILAEERGERTGGVGLQEGVPLGEGADSIASPKKSGEFKVFGGGGCSRFGEIAWLVASLRGRGGTTRIGEASGRCTRCLLRRVAPSHGLDGGGKGIAHRQGTRSTPRRKIAPSIVGGALTFALFTERKERRSSYRGKAQSAEGGGVPSV